MVTAVQPRQQEWQGHLAMLGFSALVAGSFALGARSANTLDPAVLNAVRFAIAVPFLGALALVRHRFSRQMLVAPWRYVILGGLMATYFVLMFEGLKTAPSVSAAAVFTLTPIASAGFGWIVARQTTSPFMAMALTIGAIGALFVIFRADLRTFLAFEVGRGEMVYFLGCMAHAMYTPLVPKLNRGETPLAFAFGTLFAATVLLAIYSLDKVLVTDWTVVPQITWITIVYTAVAATAMTFVLLQFASMRLPAAKVMAYTYLVPSWVILWEILLGGPSVAPLVLVGVVLTIVALLCLLRPTR